MPKRRADRRAGDHHRHQRAGRARRPTKRYVIRDDQEQHQLLGVDRGWRGDRTKTPPRPASRRRRRPAARRTTAPRRARDRRRAAPTQHTNAIARKDLRCRDRELQRRRRRQTGRRGRPARTIVLPTGCEASRAMGVGHASILARPRPRVPAESVRGSGSRPARRRAGRRAGTAARRRRPTAIGNPRLRHGADRSGSVGPYSPTIGTRVVAAICSGPLSPPMKSAARSSRARSSASENSPHVEHARSGIDIQRRACAAARPRPRPPLPKAPELTMMRRNGASRERRGQRDEMFERPAPERVAGADVDRRSVRARPIRRPQGAG